MTDERYVLLRVPDAALWLHGGVRHPMLLERLFWAPRDRVVAAGTLAACEAAKRLMEGE